MTVVRGSDAGPVRYRLVGIPLRDLALARQHYDGLFRELALIEVHDGDAAGGAPAGVLEMSRRLRDRYATFGSGPDRELRDAVRRGDSTIDLEFLLHGDVGADAAEFREALRELDALCAAGRLMTAPPSADVVRFREWYLGQFVERPTGAVRGPGQVRT